MKVFIVFSAIFMMAFTCVVYQGDMNVYMHDQETLKMIAEEAACQAAMCFDDEAYGEGIKRFRKDDAEDMVAEYSATAKGLLAKGRGCRLTFDMDYEDDENGYSQGNDDKAPSVTVTVTASGNEYFRLPFLSREKITRRSEYELKGL